MFKMHDSAYNLRNANNVVLPKFKTVRYGKNFVLHRCQIVEFTR